jgi:hypothetical protein
MKIWDSPYFRSIRDIDQILTESTTIINERLGLSVVNIFMSGPDIVTGNDRKDIMVRSKSKTVKVGETGYSVSLFQENAISTAARTLLPFVCGSSNDHHFETIIAGIREN